MAETNVPTGTDSDNPSRRTFLKQAPAGALAVTAAAVLPAGVAIAAGRPEVDPGLAKLERGYARWQKLWSKADALAPMQDAAYDRARARLPEGEPEPVMSETVARLSKTVGNLIDEARDPTSPVSIPQAVIDEYDAYWAERRRWMDGRPTLVGDPDYEESKEIEADREELWAQAERLRLKLLKIPTTSPRGLLIKLALTIDAKNFDDIDERFAKPNYYGTFDDSKALLPPLLVDLRAMLGEA